MIKKISLFSTSLFCTFFLFGQSTVFHGKLVNKTETSTIDKYFKAYNVYQIDATAMHNYAMKSSSENLQFQLDLGGTQKFNLDVLENKIFKPGIQVKLATENGVVPGKLSKIKCYIGYVAGTDKQACLSVNDKFLSGFINVNGEELFFEPVWYLDPSAPKDQFVFYYAKDYIETKTFKCLALEMKDQAEDINQKVKNEKFQAELSPLDCKEVQIAEASDLLMCNKYGNVDGVQDRITSVINSVQANYYGSFNTDLTLIISDWFNVDCGVGGTDPWTNSTDAGTLLNSFTAWGPSHFATHDIGQLFTNRDFDGGTVGIAWVAAVCTSSRYSCIQDWTSNGNLIRVTTAHEIGHNFSCQHDASGSPYIMAPAVNNTNAWSSASISSFNSYVPTRSCLTACTGGGPAPEADFTADDTEGCKPFTVHFTDLSTNTPTSWSWNFTGGTPATSNVKNPTVVYNTAGVYNVSLTASNASGSDTKTKTQYITVKDKPLANFTFTKNLGSVQFTNSSIGGDTYDWVFGDGEFSSEENPFHEYQDPGIYKVTFTVTNECGTSSKTTNITIVFIPLADFSSNITEGCIPMTVSFHDESTFEPTSWLWTFPGGTPATSTLQNPLISYNTAGTFDVTLKATNSAGSNTITIKNYIKAQDKPKPSFTFTLAGYKATFTNKTPGNDNTFQWVFGDGDSSKLQDPVHTFKNSGDFIVKLYASNNCGTSVFIDTLNILAIPKASFGSDVKTGCTPLTVKYSDTSTNSPTSWKWTFAGGTPSAATTQNPTVVYNTPGMYAVTLIASNAVGSDTILIANYINAITIPVANFNVIMTGNVAVCTNTSTYGATYLWDFGDGSTSTMENPTHTYSTEGSFSIKLTVTNPCGSNTVTKSVSSVFLPTAAFTADKTTGCAPLTVNFMNTSSTNASSFVWTFEGGTPGTSTQKNPTISFANPGTYTVSLIATNSAGSDTATIVSYITVQSKPTASFTYLNSNGSTYFSNTSTGANSYQWFFGDGSESNMASPTHDFAMNIMYDVTLIAINDCGADTVHQTILVVFPPKANFSSDKMVGCNNLVVQFQDLSTNEPTEWAWTFEGGTPASSTAQNPTVSYNSVGSYDVTLIATNSAGSDTILLKDFILVSSIVPTAIFTPSNIGLSYTFTNTSVNAYSYEWTFGDGGTSIEKDPIHDYAMGGTYSVVLIAKNGCGSDTTSVSISVVGTAPNGKFDKSIGAGCLPLTVSFKDKSTGAATAWNWSFPGGDPSSSTEQNPIVIYNAAGEYNVVLIVSNLYGSDTITQVSAIKVNGTPSAKFTFVSNGSIVSFTNLSKGASSYLWKFGDGTTSIEENPVHAYTSPGKFTVELTATNECGSFTFTEIVDVQVSVKEIDFIQNIQLYPNPNKGNFVLEILSTQNRKIQLSIVDVLGRIVYKSNVEILAGSSKKEFNVPGLSAGNYMILLQSDDAVSVKKMIVE